MEGLQVGDIWNKEMDRILFLNEKYNTSCEDMETVSVYKVGTNFNVPVLGIRIVSNNEIYNEEFDGTLAKECQKFVEQVCKEYIKSL